MTDRADTIAEIKVQIEEVKQEVERTNREEDIAEIKALIARIVRAQRPTDDDGAYDHSPLIFIE